MVTRVMRTWPRRTAGPRVLVEIEAEAIGDGAQRALRECGYDVAVCAGPASLRYGQCPMVTDGRCTLVDSADVVVHALDSDRVENRRILGAIRRCSPDTPVVVEVAERSSAGRRVVLPAGCRRVRFPMTRESLLRAVGDAVRPYPPGPATPDLPAGLTSAEEQ